MYLSKNECLRKISACSMRQNNFEKDRSKKQHYQYRQFHPDCQKMKAGKYRFPNLNYSLSQRRGARRV